MIRVHTFTSSLRYSGPASITLDELCDSRVGRRHLGKPHESSVVAASPAAGVLAFRGTPALRRAEEIRVMNVLHISRLRNQDQGSGFAAALILGRRPFQTRRHGQRGVLDVSGDESCQIKERPLESVRAGTTDAVLSEIGEAAVFKPDACLCKRVRTRKGPHPGGAPRRSVRAREEGSSNRVAEVGCVAAVAVLSEKPALLATM